MFSQHRMIRSKFGLLHLIWRLQTQDYRTHKGYFDYSLEKIPQNGICSTRYAVQFCKNIIECLCRLCLVQAQCCTLHAQFHFQFDTYFQIIVSLKGTVGLSSHKLEVRCPLWCEVVFILWVRSSPFYLSPFITLFRYYLSLYITLYR